MLGIEKAVGQVSPCRQPHHLGGHLKLASTSVTVESVRRYNMMLLWLELHILTHIMWLDAGAQQARLAFMSEFVCHTNQNFTFG